MIICGTGHRPNKLGGYSKEVFDKLVSTAHMYLCAGEEVDKVISGGALGWDQALATAARDLRIPYIMALPFPGFENRWPLESQLYLYSLTASASKIHFVMDGPYAAWKMQSRNVWMVDNSDKVLALWDGSPGGTGNCIAYANKVGKPIINLWEIYNDRAGTEQRREA